jgi:hypothetical protein
VLSRNVDGICIVEPVRLKLPSPTVQLVAVTPWFVGGLFHACNFSGAAGGWRCADRVSELLTRPLFLRAVVLVLCGGSLVADVAAPVFTAANLNTAGSGTLLAKYRPASCRV